MNNTRIGCRLALLAACLAAGAAGATPVEIATGDPQNGIFDIYSATFDPPLNPDCTGQPSYCTFFGGKPPPTRAIVLTVNPTTVTTGVPGGIEDPAAIPPVPAPPPAAFLDLTVSPDKTSVTLAGGVLKFPSLVLSINTTTIVTATGAGFVFNTTPQTAPLNASGQAEFLVNLAPATAVDFSKFSVVVTSCTGPLCALIPILTLDMIRYRLLLDYDASYGSFTGSFIGQTANNSMVFANLNSGVPNITVADSQPPGDDLQIPFGDVTELTSATRSVTVSNTGGGSLFVGNVAQANPLASPFAVTNDGCSGQTLALAQTCNFNVTFSPGFVGPFTDSLDIPSNDADTPAATVSVSGNGIVSVVPDIEVTDSVPPGDDGAVPFGTTVVGGESDQTVTVTNSGNADLVLGQVAMADPLAAPYSIQSDACSGQTLAPTAICTIGLRFEPTATGSFPEHFDIPSNDADTPSALVTVSGTGAIAVPNIAITDPTAPDDDHAVSFDDVRVAGFFDRTITITNTGNSPLTIGTIGAVISLAAPFSIVPGEDDCSGQSVAAAAICTVTVRFEPDAIADFADDFDIPSNDPDEPSVTVSFAGSGVESPVPQNPQPSGADSGFMALDPATLIAVGALGAALRRRRLAAQSAGA